MAERRREPVWLTRLVVDAIHHDQLREHGGLPRVRDENVLESALARPRQYTPDADLGALAASYAFGLVRNHPYRDGNKRVGFLAMLTFLGLNGLEFEATEPEVVEHILRLAAGHLSEHDVAEWIRSRARPLK